MIGSLSEELGVDPTVSVADAEAATRTEFGANADTIIGAYPFTTSPAWAEAQAFSDENFACVDRYTARHAAMAGSHPVFRYVFTHGLTESPPTPGAYHRLDIGFVLGDIEAESNGPYTPSAAELALSKAMMDAWHNFAVSGNPGFPWNRASPSSGLGVMLWDTTSHFVADYHSVACEVSWPL
jgi:carboxylesterase type B